LLRRALSPIDRLVERMRTVDLLLPGQRLAERGGPGGGEGVHAVNQMLDRLERGAPGSNRRAPPGPGGAPGRGGRDAPDAEGAGGVLAGGLLQRAAAAAAEGGGGRVRVDEAKPAIRAALEEVRRISQELRPELLEHLGLVSALTELSGQFARQSGVDVERRFAADLPTLSPETELAVYRVTQESLTNVSRHAQAPRVELT